MSAEILAQLFLGETQNPRLDEILRQYVAEATASEPGLTPSGCLLTDMGNFLLRATNILSGLANGIVYGQHIRTYTREKAREMSEDHDSLELNLLVYMDEKYTSLKFVTADRPLSCSVLTSSLDLLPRVWIKQWKTSPSRGQELQSYQSGSGERIRTQAHFFFRIYLSWLLHSTRRARNHVGSWNELHQLANDRRRFPAEVSRLGMAAVHRLAPTDRDKPRHMMPQIPY
jgi:hypothetical protein